MTAPGEAATAKARILIVEDDELIRDFLSDSLEMKGFLPAHVGDGSAALRYLESHEVDLVLSDVRMPELDGVGLAKKLAEIAPHLPVVLITGVHAAERDQIMEESGAAACLPKPLKITQLCDVLTSLCAGS